MGKNKKNLNCSAPIGRNFGDFEADRETNLICGTQANEYERNDEGFEDEMVSQDSEDNFENPTKKSKNHSKTDTVTYKERKYLCRGCYVALKGAHERLFGKKMGHNSEDKLSTYQSINDFLHYTQFFDLAHFTEENSAGAPLILHLIYLNLEKEEQSLCDSTINEVTDLIFQRVILPSMTPEERKRHFTQINKSPYSSSTLNGQKESLSASFYI